MKTKLYLPIISLLAMSVFAFISCDDSDSDTTKPVIELSEPEEGQIKGYQMSIFGVPIPYITYNIKF